MTSNQTHVNKDTIEAAIPAPKEPNTNKKMNTLAKHIAGYNSFWFLMVFLNYFICCHSSLQTEIIHFSFILFFEARLPLIFSSFEKINYWRF